tara:strand:- start:101274 stop:102377 length:1104 start_codon:yes stop_codon:yes gene_type:complete
MQVNRPLIRTIQDDPSDRSAGILAADPRLVPTGTRESIVPVDWQSAMKRAIRSTTELRQRLGLPTETACHAAAEADFPTFVPLEFLSRIEPGNPDDPLLRQVLATESEQSDAADFVSDPVGDLAAMAAPSLIQKYRGRALVISTGACGVHCRYCFRRSFPYSEVGTPARSTQSAIDYLRKSPEVDEVILSGGDPLTLVDVKLFELIEQIESIPRVKRLRIHTRMPVVIPQRVTPDLVQRLRHSRLATWFVIHANHAQELDAHVLDHIGLLVDVGIPVLNQAVLLRGVNDDAEALIRLSRTLVDHRVQPYYLHQLDRVRGAAHFEVSVDRGVQLVAEMRKQLPGYAVPTYVREEPGEPSKTAIVDDSL